MARCRAIHRHLVFLVEICIHTISYEEISQETSDFHKERHARQFIAQSDHGIDTVARRAGTKVASSRRSQSSDGEAVCPPRLCLTLFERIAKESPVSSEPRRRLFTDTSGLTSRQRQLMALVAQGFTNEEIAARLHLSEFTVKNHIHCIMKHMAADSRHEAVDRLLASGRSLRLRPLRISLSLQTTHVRRHSEPASVE